MSALDITVTVRNLGDLRRRIQGRDPFAQAAMATWVGRELEMAKAELMVATPEGPTGEARRGWHIVPMGYRTGKVVNTSPHIVYLMFDTRARPPQVMYPKSGGPFRFFSPLFGQIVYREWVRRVGYPPNAHLRAVYFSLSSQVRADFRADGARVTVSALFSNEDFNRRWTR